MIANANPLVLKGLIGFSIFSSVLYAIASFVTASYSCGLNIKCMQGTTNLASSFGTSAGEGFVIVIFGLAFCAYCGLSFFALSPSKIGPIFSGAQISSSIFVILTSLFLAVWAGLKTSSMEKGASNIVIAEEVKAKLDSGYVSALSTMIAGASLLLIAQTAFLALYLKWKSQLLGTTDANSGAAASYAASYEPGAYFDAAAQPSA